MSRKLRAAASGSGSRQLLRLGVARDLEGGGDFLHDLDSLMAFSRVCRMKRWYGIPRRFEQEVGSSNLSAVPIASRSSSTLSKRA